MQNSHLLRNQHNTDVLVGKTNSVAVINERSGNSCKINSVSCATSPLITVRLNGELIVFDADASKLAITSSLTKFVGLSSHCVLSSSSSSCVTDVVAFELLLVARSKKSRSSSMQMFSWFISILIDSSRLVAVNAGGGVEVATGSPTGRT